MNFGINSSLVLALGPDLDLKTHVKIFGKVLSKKKQNRNLIDILFHLAQKEIWVTRNIDNRDGFKYNIWITFTNALQTTMGRPERVTSKGAHVCLFHSLRA